MPTGWVGVLLTHGMIGYSNPQPKMNGVGFKMNKEILDATCGGRSIWHSENKDRDDTLYIDKRDEDAGFLEREKYGYNKRNYSIDPDQQEDYRDLPYDGESFNLVVFDPPHAIRPDGMKSLSGVTHKKWGCLHAETWQEDLRDGFEELWRVLSPRGTLIFKFANESADFKEVLDLAPSDPLFGTSTKDGTVETRWFVFYKPEE
jgi:SAM-dependent methyltransferase